MVNGFESFAEAHIDVKPIIFEPSGCVQRKGGKQDMNTNLGIHVGRHLINAACGDASCWRI